MKRIETPEMEELIAAVAVREWYARELIRILEQKQEGQTWPEIPDGEGARQ